MKILGIDTSKWSGFMDWRLAVNNGAQFAYIKASQWDKDPRFTESWINSHGILPRGAYHYLDWGWSETKQAELMVKILGADIGELPPCLDLEQDPAPYGLAPEMVCVKVRRFLDTLERLTGRIPIIYVGYYFWREWGSTADRWARYPLWLPWYAPMAYIQFRTGGTGAPKPWPNWTIWQFTSSGKGLAYGAQALRMDENQFNGTEADLAFFAGGAPIPASLPPIADLYAANCSPRVRSSPDLSSIDNVIGMLVKGNRVIVDREQGSWSHFLPQASFPAGGWVWSAYLTKI